MKHITTSLLALAVIFCANAQDEPTVTTGSLYPVDHNVYNPEYYNNVMQVSYDNEIVATNASATLTVNGTTTTLALVEVAEYGFAIDLSNITNLVPQNAQFTINVTGVTPAEDTNDSVEEITGTYLLRNSFPTVTSVTPADGSELSSPTTSVTVTFNESVNVGEIFFTSGRFMNQKVNYVEVGKVNVKSVTAEIEEDYWSKTDNPSTMMVRLASVSVGDGWLVPDYIYNYTYQFPAVTAKYIGYEPTNEEVTVWEAYGDGWGFVDLVFSAEVNYDSAEITVTYTLSGKPREKYTVSSVDLWGDWSFWDGNYHLQIPLPIGKNVTEENLTSITIDASGIYSNGNDIEIEQIKYDNKTLPQTQKIKKSNNAGISSSLAKDEIVKIYTIQGVLINDNASLNDVNNLTSGMYIINGKKILVRN